MSNDQRKRLKVVIKGLLLTLIAGLLYYIILRHTGIYIPCLFRVVTGFKCPGCGITHMCESMLNSIFIQGSLGDRLYYLREAFISNSFAMVVSPYIIYSILKDCIIWVENGEIHESKVDTVIKYAIIVMILVWTVFRNIV